MMMKRCLFVLTLAGLVYAVSSSAFAQDNGSNAQQSAPSTAQPEHGAGGRYHMDPEKRAEALGKKLKLSADQQSKVLDIFKSEQSQMESLRSDSSVAQSDRRSKMMEIHKSTNEQIRALLDPDQQKKWDEMQSNKMEGHHHGGAAPSGAPESSPPPQ
jgi:periplasmic protein CpxP/Spy